MHLTIRDQDTNEEVILTVAISEEDFSKLSEREQDEIIEKVAFDYYENKAAEEILSQFN